MILSKSAGAAVVTPPCPSPQEAFAAEELCKYIRLLCGAAVTVADAPQPGLPTILLGSPDRNPHTAAHISPAEFDAVCPGPEGIFIQSYGSDVLVVAGSRGDFERGTIYAVYELVERFFGASLSAFSHPDADAGEYVPFQEQLDTAGLSYCKSACDLPYRTAIVQYADAAGDCNRGLNLPFLDWLCKNRYNRILTWARCYEELKRLGVLAEAERRGLRFTVGHHDSSKLFLPPHGNEYFPEHYFETHPEFYKLQEDGCRYEDTHYNGQWVFCSRSPGLTEELAANVITWIEKNPLVDIIAFWPNDGIYPQCVCPQCAAHSKVENYTHVLNEVAKRVSAVYPQVKIDMLAYTDLFACPEHVKLERALMIDESTWHSTGLRTVGKPDGSSLIGTLFDENLERWRCAGADVVVYDYYMGVYPARQRTIPMADEVQAIFRAFRQKGYLGSGTQIECFNLWNHLFNFYSFARTAYDTSLSMEDNLARFSRIFGKGAPEVCAVIRYAEELLDGQAPVDTAALWLVDHIDKEKVYALYDEALAKADTPRTRNNIRLMRMAWRYTDLETSLPGARNFEKYHSVNEYAEPTGELALLGEFDSFWNNDPGFGIDIPAKSTAGGSFEKNIWYQFD